MSFACAILQKALPYVTNKNSCSFHGHGEYCLNTDLDPVLVGEKLYQIHNAAYHTQVACT